MFILFFPAALCIYIVRDGVFHKIILEVISFSKPLFFLLLFHFVYIHRVYFKKKLDKIILITLFTYSIPIFFSSFTGIGLYVYEAFYSATKSFFYGNNVTSITGLTLSIYYAYKLRTGKINYLYYSLAFVALFLSGGKIILTVPLLTLLIYLYTGNSSRLRMVVISFGLLVVSTLFISGAFSPGFFINNSFTNRYFTRAFREGLTEYDIRQRINILPLRLYSYASITRASRANNAINQILREPENIFFGYGIYIDSQISGNKYTVEMDIIDMLYYYGIIGFLLIYIPIFKIIIPLIIRRNTGMNAMVIYLIFIYSSLAGHVLTTPMAGSLFALFLGLGSNFRGVTDMVTPRNAPSNS